MAARKAKPGKLIAPCRAAADGAAMRRADQSSPHAVIASRAVVASTTGVTSTTVASSVKVAVTIAASATTRPSNRCGDPLLKCAAMVPR